MHDSTEVLKAILVVCTSAMLWVRKKCVTCMGPREEGGGGYSSGGVYQTMFS